MDDNIEFKNNEENHLKLFKEFERKIIIFLRKLRNNIITIKFNMEYQKAMKFKFE
jgi:hypothetical protein